LTAALQTICDFPIIPHHTQFDTLLKKLADTCKLEEHDEKAKIKAICSINTYYKLAECAIQAANLIDILPAAKKHAIERLVEWSQAEYNGTLRHTATSSEEDSDASLISDSSHHEWEAWVQSRLKLYASNHGCDVTVQVLVARGLEWDEEDEMIRMLSMFASDKFTHENASTADFQELGMSHKYSGKVDIALAAIVGEEAALSRHCLERFDDLLAYFDRLEQHAYSDTKEAQQLLLLMVMKVWRCLECVHLVHSGQEKQYDALHSLPYLDMIGVATSPPKKTWMSDNRNLTKVSVGLVVIIGLLCASAPLSTVITNRHIIAAKRALISLTTHDSLHR